MDFLNSDSDDDDDNNAIDNSTVDSLILQRPRNCGILSFHNGTEESMLLYIYKNSVKNDVTSILNAIDNFCWSRHWMMHLGPEKSVFLIDILNKMNNDIKKPMIMIEIGYYCGYSSILLGKYLNENGHLFCIESNEKCVQWTKQLIKWAGLENKVTVIHMDVSNEDELFKRLKTDITDTIDLLFIDHEKSRYLTDLIAFERSGLMTKGTIVVADNILSLGIPLSDYIDHVKDENGLYISSETKTASLEYSRANNTIKTVEVDGSDISLDDGIEISIFK